MPSYKPTVYEQIASDFLAGKKLKYEDYAEELSSRGWKEKRYFDAYVEDMKYIKSLMDSPNFNLREAADIVKQNHPSKNEDVLKFSLTPDEKKIVLDAEELGSVKDGETIEYEGYGKQIKCSDYENLPKETDAFVIFSGHPGSAEPAIESWLTDFKKTGKLKKLVFLGLYDNQGNTDFSQQGLEYNTGSEVEMYVRYCRKLGIPEEVLQECIVTPTDTSTSDNIKLLAEIRNKYFADKKDVSFAMFGYPAYQKRIASEFSYVFNKLEKDGKVKSTHFIMPAVPKSRNEQERYLSYDNLDGIAQDIIIGNCLAHPYRLADGGRFDSKLGKYPEKFKPLLPISLVYSYPNVANELAGTDTKTATMMKLLRAVQHSVYQFENPHRIDLTIKANLFHLSKKLSLKGLLPQQLMATGNKMGKDFWKKATKEYQSKDDINLNATEAAKALYGPNASEKKLKPVIEYLKKTIKQKR